MDTPPGRPSSRTDTSRLNRKSSTDSRASSTSRPSHGRRVASNYSRSVSSSSVDEHQIGCTRTLESRESSFQGDPPSKITDRLSLVEVEVLNSSNKISRMEVDLKKAHNKLDSILEGLRALSPGIIPDAATTAPILSEGSTPKQSVVRLPAKPNPDYSRPRLNRLDENIQAFHMTPSVVESQRSGSPDSFGIMSAASLDHHSESNDFKDFGKPKESIKAPARPRVLNSSAAFMIDPRGSFRRTWDLGVLMPCLVYLGVMLPFRLTFENEAKQFTPMYWFEFLIDMAFLMDILLNFRTGIVLDMGAPLHTGLNDKELIEYDRWGVAKKYLKNWFILDLLSGVPYMLIKLLASGSEAGVFKGAKMFKLMRFLKLGRLLKFDRVIKNLDHDTVDSIEDFLQDDKTRSAALILQLSFILCYSCHLLSCGWVAVGRSCSRKGAPSWLDYDVKGPFDHEDTMGKESGSIYIASFYFCLTTMTSVGFGDITPRGNTERVYCIFL